MLKIYLDNCCYGRPFDNQKDPAIRAETQAKVFIQSLVKYKALELVYSSISIEEITAIPFEENSQSILDLSKISANEFDYTKWRENLWENLTPRELFERAAKTEEDYNIPKGVVRI